MSRKNNACPSYMMPTTSSAMRASITQKENLQKGRTSNVTMKAMTSKASGDGENTEYQYARHTGMSHGDNSSEFASKTRTESQSPKMSTSDDERHSVLCGLAISEENGLTQNFDISTCIHKNHPVALTFTERKSSETTSHVGNLPLQSQTNRGLTRSTSLATEDKIYRKYSKEKLWRPESANIDKNIDSKLQDDDTPFSSLPERALSPIDTSANSKKKSSEEELIDNLLFYQGKIKSKPAPGYYITDMLKWKGDYDQLERNHLYIQWLFPIHESRGLNRAAQALTDFEAKAIQQDDKAHERVLKAYKMMLDFYGMVLDNEINGTVRRSEENYIERYDNINRYRHNLLRITRIIKSMGELGYQNLQAPLVNFLYDECIIHRTLANFRQSCFDHWINAIYDDNERAKMYRRFHGFPAEIDSLTFNAEGGYNETAKKYEDFVQGTENGIDNPLKENLGSHDLCASGLRDKSDDIRKREPISDQLNGELFSDHKQDKLNSDNSKMEEIIDDRASIHVDKKSQTKVHDHGARQKDMKSTTLHKGKGINKELSFVESRDQSLDEPRAAASSTVVTKDMDIEVMKKCDNLKFYRNEILSRPPQGYTIDTILQHHGDYKFLDEYPYFIKWLFPTPSSLDVNTQELLQFEAKAIVDDRVTFRRVQQAYELVLDYYGFKMVDDELKKTKHWKSRWNVLNVSSHPEMRRITRVLASLGELGCKRYQVPLIEIFIKNKKEIVEFEWITVLYWIDTVKDVGEREKLFEKYGKQVFSDKTLNSFSRPNR